MVLINVAQDEQRQFVVGGVNGTNAASLVSGGSLRKSRMRPWVIRLMAINSYVCCLSYAFRFLNNDRI